MSGKSVIDRLSRERPILVAGPTASGKSALALRLARRDGRVVVNADAIQVYACWHILSARPDAAAERAAPHALYGHVARDMPYSVGHWLREVDALVDGRPIVIVGGTGLYFMALTRGLAPIPAIPPAIREEADALMANDPAAMRAALDPPTAARIDLRNPARVQRAWEVLRATGRGLAAWQEVTPPPLLPEERAECVVICPEREQLNRRIDARFDAMMRAGALDEAARELPHWQPRRPSAQAIGAAELIAHLQGRLTRDDAIRAAKQATRRYAKRQRTWLRGHMKGWCVLETPAGA